MKLFKSKEEKEFIKSQNLINEVNELNLKYKNELKSYCMIKTYVFIFHEFMIKDNELYIEFIDTNTPKGCVKQLPYDKSFLIDYDLKELRMNWIIFKEKIERLGVEVNFINNTQ